MDLTLKNISKVLCQVIWFAFYFHVKIIMFSNLIDLEEGRIDFDTPGARVLYHVCPDSVILHHYPYPIILSLLIEIVNIWLLRSIFRLNKSTTVYYMVILSVSIWISVHGVGYFRLDNHLISVFVLACLCYGIPFITSIILILMSL